MKIAESLISALSKRRRLILVLNGCGKVNALPIRILGDKVRVYKRRPQGRAEMCTVPMATIESIWDPASGERLWPK
jgi:hypothetical protein